MSETVYTIKNAANAKAFKELGYPVGYSVADMQAYLMPRKTRASNRATGEQQLNSVQSDMAGPTQFATLTMISVSTHRDKFPVSSLSKKDPTGFALGHRTTAGSMTFSTFDRAVFSGMLSGNKYKNVHADEIPLFDMMVLLSDDTGNVSALELYGITILDGSMVLSLDNISPNETYSYMALKMKPLSRRDSDYNSTNTETGNESTDGIWSTTITKGTGIVGDAASKDITIAPSISGIGFSANQVNTTPQVVPKRYDVPPQVYKQDFINSLLAMERQEAKVRLTGAEIREFASTVARNNRNNYGADAYGGPDYLTLVNWAKNDPRFKARMRR